MEYDIGRGCKDLVCVFYVYSKMYRRSSINTIVCRIHNQFKNNTVEYVIIYNKKSAYIVKCILIL